MGDVSCNHCKKAIHSHEVSTCPACGAVLCNECTAANGNMCTECYEDLGYLN